ncbi:MAG: gamma-glutamylcyclotransferase [Terriglobales bacterium]
MRKSSNSGQNAKRYLFSYGTLLPRLAPPEIKSTVRRLRRVGRGFVRGHLFDLGEYPGAILTRTGSEIAGQIFELPDDPSVLDRLDEYEGFDPTNPASSLFVRKRRRVQSQDGRRIFCWIYSYNRPVAAARRLGGGIYSKARTQQAL